MEPMTMKRVEFSMANVQKCQCGVCPVQQDSSCVMEKTREMQSMGGPGAQGMPAPEAVPGLY